MIQFEYWVGQCVWSIPITIIIIFIRFLRRKNRTQTTPTYSQYQCSNSAAYTTETATSHVKLMESNGGWIISCCQQLTTNRSRWEEVSWNVRRNVQVNYVTPLSQGLIPLVIEEFLPQAFTIEEGHRHLEHKTAHLDKPCYIGEERVTTLRTAAYRVLLSHQNARIHWLVHSHMTSNNRTFFRQKPISVWHYENYDVRG